MLVAGLGLVGVGGCAQLHAAYETERAVSAAGYRVFAANVSSGTGGTVVTVRYRSPWAGAGATPGEIGPLRLEEQAIARVVWLHVHEPLDGIAVEPLSPQGLVGSVSFPQFFTRPELVALFGPRPAGLDHATAGAFEWVGLGVVIGFLILVTAGTVLLVVLIRRARRRSAGQGYGGPLVAGYPVPSGWAPPPGAAGWAPPPGAAGWSPPGVPGWTQPGTPTPPTPTTSPTPTTPPAPGGAP